MPKGKQNVKTPIAPNKGYKFSETVTVYGVTTAKAECSAMAMDYYWRYGVTQSHNDCVAGVAKAMKEANERNKDTDDHLDGADLEEAIDRALAELVQERKDRIQNGMIAVRVAGPRLYGIDKLLRDVTDEHIRAEAVKAGKNMPNGERLVKIREIMFAARKDVITAEANRRLAAQDELAKVEESVIDFDASDESLGIESQVAA